ncbi:hypothetical protein [Paenibacillus apiarius]|uniref:hypothetical protein n=1 Tax=Paenibacillus apiarius TaxID=46240 RepID=UPI002DBA981E|nr:hypothetical protein [Paenibacillus apiarius]
MASVQINDGRPLSCADLKNAIILWEQTFSFNTTDKPEFLLLDGFEYIKTYNKKISIPVDIKK